MIMMQVIWQSEAICLFMGIQSEEGFIFAKTGTLSGVVALSGFIYTKKNKMLIFSILVNNHQASATQVRRAMEKFVLGLREKN